VRQLALLLALATAPLLAQDAISVGSVAAAPFGHVALPVYLQDVSPTGTIHSISFRVFVTPATAAANASFERAGVLATATPLYERVSASGSSVGYLASFAEPLLLSPSAPGSRIGTVHLDLGGVGNGTVLRVSFDPVATVLANEDVTATETQYNRQLALHGGEINVGGTSTTTTVGATPSPSTVGQTVTFTATVNPAAATGTVAFYDGAQLLGQVALGSGTATLNTADLSQGSHSIKASYEGSSSHQGSSSTITHTVSAPAIAAPASVAATATSTTTVEISWPIVANAIAYEVHRSANGSAYVPAGSTASTTLTDTVAPGTTYLYKVRAMATGGAFSPFSPMDPATTIVFTDDPLVAGVTAKLAHLTELRAAVNAFRASAGLGPASFTDPSASIGTRIRRDHVQELRTALLSARSTLGLPSLTLTDPTITLGSTLKAVHLQELRNGVK
jgi:hypothetical protein